MGLVGYWIIRLKTSIVTHKMTSTYQHQYSSAWRSMSKQSQSWKMLLHFIGFTFSAPHQKNGKNDAANPGSTSMHKPMGRRTGQNSQLQLCVLNFIYACSTSFMRVQLHLSVPNFIYACSTSYMHAQLHLCVLNFIYACSISFMLAQLHLYSLNFSPCSICFHHAQHFWPCPTFSPFSLMFSPPLKPFE